MAVVDGFGETEDVAITILVDNRADLLDDSTATVKRFNDKPLLAEHGFAALVDLKAAGVRILWDSGMSAGTLVENMARMKIAPSSINMIALSHGHGDHTAGLTNVLKAMGVGPTPRTWDAATPMAEMRQWAEQRRPSIVLHPAALRELWRVQKDGKMYGPMHAPWREWEAAGARLAPSESAYRLAEGCWTTGFVPRTSFETAGINARLRYRDGDQLLPYLVEDDQAMVINVRGKGLVVLAGCAHAGILNTVRHAQDISGQQRVWAILGGFHLAPASAADVQRTVDGIAALQPALIAPTHCTGFAATAEFAARVPQAFVICSVGTTFLF